MNRRLTTALCSALALAAIGLLVLGSPDQVDALSNGVIFGAYAQPIDGQTNQQAVERLETTMDAKLPMVRAFADWDDPIGEDKPLHRWIRDGGRDLMVSVKPQREDGSIVTWRQVANAQPGSRIYREMQTLATGIEGYGQPVIVGFHHEPEQGNNQKFGSSADFRAAFRAFRQVFDSEGITNAHFAWIMTEWSFEVETIDPQDRRRADFWYPGDDVVDMIASDTYNWNNCRGNTTDPWRPLDEDIAPLMRFSDKHPDKPLILAEFGSDEAAAGRKAAWIQDARELFKTAPYKNRFAAVLYFHDDGRAEGWPECEWWLDSSTGAKNAAKAWVNDPFYRVDLGLPAGRPPSPTTTTTTSTPRPPNVVTERCNGRAATIVGTSGNDQLRGTPSADVIVGRGGDDVIAGLGGNDIICGGDGNDKITGDGGADQLYGGTGRDLLRGGLGPDILVGGTGPDRLNGQHGNDEVYGGPGNDVMRGGPHQDILRGGANADTILGQGGRDIITGGDGNDALTGGVGADQLGGGNGIDRCDGGPGADTATRCERGNP